MIRELYKTREVVGSELTDLIKVYHPRLLARARRPAQTAGCAGVNAIRLRIASKGFIHLWLQFLPYRRAGGAAKPP